MKSLLPNIDPFTYRKGMLLYAHGPEALYHVLTGAVRIYRTNDAGDQLSVMLAGPGAWFGQSAALTESAVALTTSHVQVYRREVFYPFVGGAKFEAALNGVSNKIIEELYTRLAAFSNHFVDDRLHYILEYAARRAGTPEAKGIVLPPLTHEVLSTFIGTSREIVTATMGSFRRKGYLDFNRRGIVLYPAFFTAGAHVRAKSVKATGEAN